MTLSPRLPAGFACDAAEPGPADAEMNRMTELALCRGARLVAVGRGRSATAERAVAAFTCHWKAREGAVLDVVTWPEEARPACVRPPGSPQRTRTCGSWRGLRVDGRK